MAVVAVRPRHYLGLGEAQTTRGEQTMMAGSGEHSRPSLLRMVGGATGVEEQEVALLLRTSTVRYGPHVRLRASLLVVAAAVAAVLASAGLRYLAESRVALIWNSQPR